MEQKIETLTSQMAQDQIIAQTKYNAKCSSTSCKNFLHTKCIFDNIYSKHIWQFCGLVFGICTVLLIMFIKTYLDKLDMILKMFKILLLGILLLLIFFSISHSGQEFTSEKYQEYSKLRGTNQACTIS